MKRQRKEYYTGKNYVHAREEAFARSKGMCQLCGCRKATVAHHYATKYPSSEAVTDNDFTALCQPCHDLTHYARFAAEVRIPVKPITHSGRNRSPIPAETDHPFRPKPITPFGARRRGT